MANNKRGRRAKSPEMLKLNGTYREDRHGDRADLQVGGEPKRPTHLKGEARKLWNTVVPVLVEQGYASELDSQSLTAMCEWWAEYRSAADEQVEDAKGLADLAEAIRQLAAACGDQDVSKVVYQLSFDIAKAMEGRSMQRKRRMECMSKAWREFFSIASRFGLTALDRQGIKAGGGPKADDPFVALIKAREESA